MPNFKSHPETGLHTNCSLEISAGQSTPAPPWFQKIVT